MQCSRQISQLLKIKILTLLQIEIVSKERGKMRTIQKKQCYLAVIRGPNCTSKSQCELLEDN